MLYDPTKAKTFENILTPQLKFLSAEELEVPPHIHKAFIAVHEALSNASIPKDKFRMDTIGEPSWKNKDCGSAGCLLAWAKAYNCYLTTKRIIIADLGPFHSLYQLCYPTEFGAIDCKDRNKARQALENWLTTGHANWQKVVL